MSDVTILRGDCLEVLPALADRSVDAVITDPPYPEITRRYGRWTEAEWWALIVEGVIPQVRRVLKPTGSAVLVLQPNSRKYGSMRGWLWEFLAWCCREWNVVRDVYWWNTSALPRSHQDRRRTLPRPSVKLCVWLGDANCHRNIDNVLKEVSDKVRRANPRTLRLRTNPSGWRGEGKKAKSVNQPLMYAGALARGGSTPFNFLAVGNANSTDSAGFHGHGAGTPQPLTDWWVRYLCPPGGTVLDPFLGSGTTGLSALKYGCSFIGIERDAEYCAVARARLDAARAAPPLFA